MIARLGDVGSLEKLPDALEVLFGHIIIIDDVPMFEPLPEPVPEPPTEHAESTPEPEADISPPEPATQENRATVPQRRLFIRR